MSAWFEHGHAEASCRSINPNPITRPNPRKVEMVMANKQELVEKSRVTRSSNRMLGSEKENAVCAARENCRNGSMETRVIAVRQV